MLWETYQWATTPCPSWARRSGLLYASIALGARGRRCAGAWADHLAHVKAAMLAGPGGDTVAILGSGWLHDVPVEELATRYRRIVLIDAVHPGPARRAARRHPSIELIHADVSGVLEATLAGARLPAPTPIAWAQWFDQPADLVISDLVLSQIAMSAEALAIHHGVSADEVTAWAASIRHHHLATLPPAQRTLLITDTMAQNETGDTEVVTDLALPQPHATWMWPVVPPGESLNGPVTHTVTAAWMPSRS